MGIVLLSFRPQKASSCGQQMTFVEIWGDEGLKEDTASDVKHSNTKHTFSLLLLSGNKNNSRKKQKSGKTSENHVVLVDDICCGKGQFDNCGGGNVVLLHSVQYSFTSKGFSLRLDYSGCRVGGVAM